MKFFEFPTGRLTFSSSSSSFCASWKSKLWKSGGEVNVGATCNNIDIWELRGPPPKDPQTPPLSFPLSTLIDSFVHHLRLEMNVRVGIRRRPQTQTHQRELADLDVEFGDLCLGDGALAPRAVFVTLQIGPEPVALQLAARVTAVVHVVHACNARHTERTF